MNQKNSDILKDRIVEAGDLEKTLRERADQIDAWLAETDNGSCKVEQKHCDEGTVERVYWHYGYMIGLRDALNLIKRNSTILS